MANDRYDRMRGRDEDRYDMRRDRPRGRRADYDRDDRDFFDRAGDEVRSWFGDESAERRREMDERYGYSGDGYKNQHFGFERSFDSVNDGYRRPYRRSGRAFGRSSMDNDSDYNSRRYGRSSHERDNDRAEMYDYDRGYGQNRWGRSQTQNEYTRDGGRDRDRDYTRDRDYDEWRSRQIDAFDRDYDEWRQENQSRFNDEFSSWRQTRQQKREQLRNLDRDTQVVGSDGEVIGTVSSVQGDRMIMKGEDNDTRCVFNLRDLDNVENGQAKLNLSSEDARRRMRSDTLELGSEDRMTNRSTSDNY